MRLHVSQQPTGRVALDVRSSHNEHVSPVLTVDAPIAPVADIAWAALALATPQRLTGAMTHENGISIGMARTLLRLFGDKTFLPGPAADSAGQRQSTVGITAVLDWSARGFSAGGPSANRRRIVLAPVPLNEWSGRLFSLTRFVFAASVESTGGTTRTSELGSHLAAALLIADRLRCDALEVPRFELQASPDWEARAQSIGEAVGITITFVDTATLSEDE